MERKARRGFFGDQGGVGVPLGDDLADDVLRAAIHLAHEIGRSLALPRDLVQPDGRRADHLGGADRGGHAGGEQRAGIGSLRCLFGIGAVPTFT